MRSKTICVVVKIVEWSQFICGKNAIKTRCFIFFLVLKYEFKMIVGYIV